MTIWTCCIETEEEAVSYSHSGILSETRPRAHDISGKLKKQKAYFTREHNKAQTKNKNNRKNCQISSVDTGWYTIFTVLLS